MTTILKFLLLSSKSRIIIFNNDYNSWKAKQIDRRREESKFPNIDQLSESINPDYLKDSVSSVDNSEGEIAPQPTLNLPGVNTAGIGSLSFVGGHAPKFPMANLPNKNTTFEIPKAQGKEFCLIYRLQ